MPNWVHTTLWIEGEQEHLDEFQAYVRTDDYYTNGDTPKERVTHFDFNKFIPMPIEEAENWYNWNCEHWGTKWNACHIEIDDQSEGCLCYRFETAWGRISDALWEAIKNKFPTLSFDFSADEEAGFFYSDTVNGRIVDTEGDRYDNEGEEEDE